MDDGGLEDALRAEREEKARRDRQEAARQAAERDAREKNLAAYRAVVAPAGKAFATKMREAGIEPQLIKTSRPDRTSGGYEYVRGWLVRAENSPSYAAQWIPQMYVEEDGTVVGDAHVREADRRAKTPEADLVVRELARYLASRGL